jgi:putative SOS response-associated peptidase YedK
MCGRFVQTTPAQKLAKQFEAVSKLESFEPGYNIAPTATVAVVRISTKSANRVLESLKWDLVHHWAKDPSIGAGMGNARAETVADKPSFRDPFKSQRCLVPVDGFYEWQQTTVLRDASMQASGMLGRGLSNPEISLIQRRVSNYFIENGIEY